MKKNAITTSKVTPQSKKTELKAPVKVSKVVMPRLAGNHNEILLTR